MLVHQRGEVLGIAVLECRLAAQAEVLHVMQVVYHLRVAALGTRLLLEQYLVGVARVAGEEHEQVFLEVVQRVGRCRERGDTDAAIGAEVVTARSAERGHVLVLLADRTRQSVDLDGAGLLGDVGRRHVLAQRGIDGAQQPDRERTGRAESGTRRYVGRAHYLDRWADPVRREHLANDRVRDVGGVFDPLER